LNLPAPRRVLGGRGPRPPDERCPLHTRSIPRRRQSAMGLLRRVVGSSRSSPRFVFFGVLNTARTCLDLRLVLIMMRSERGSGV